MNELEFDNSVRASAKRIVSSGLRTAGQVLNGVLLVVIITVVPVSLVVVELDNRTPWVHPTAQIVS